MRSSPDEGEASERHDCHAEIMRDYLVVPRLTDNSPGQAFESALFLLREGNTFPRSENVPGQEVVVDSGEDAVLPSAKTGNPALTRLAYASTLAALIRMVSEASSSDSPNLLGLKPRTDFPLLSDMLVPPDQITNRKRLCLNLRVWQNSM
jgi:hypothetical protein